MEIENVVDKQKTEFFPVQVSLLQIDKIIHFDLYIQPDKLKPPVLYRSKNLPITEKDINRLSELGCTTLYVPFQEKVLYTHYLESNLKSILTDPSVPTLKKTEVLYNVTTQAVKEMLDDPRSGDVIPRTQYLVENTLDFIFHHPTAFQCMLKLTCFDYYTHTHSVNVGMFSIFLAREVGLSEDTLFRLGVGALLHDIGKCMVDPKIVNFPGRLSPEQFEQMKMHPVYGYEILVNEHNVRDELQLDVVRHHHEKLTGTGYPDKLKGDEVSVYARISAIADIFDALTTRRSYKNAFRSFDALNLMKTQMCNEIDMGIFKKFIILLGKKEENI